MPATIIAGGKVWRVSLYLREGARPEATVENIRHILENWIMRGVHTGKDGMESLCYFGFTPSESRMLRVPTSMDGMTIVNTFKDSRATELWNTANWDYFTRNYANWERRDENAG